VEKSLFYDWFNMHRESESADKPVFCLNSAYHTNYSYWMCNIIFAQRCVTLYKYEHRFLWLQVKTYYYNHLTASAKPVHYVPTDKINLSIRIRQMLTSFVTSLINILLTYLLAMEQSYCFCWCCCCCGWKCLITFAPFWKYTYRPIFGREFC